MSSAQRLRARLRRWFRRSEFRVWYDPSYRLPVTGLEGRLRLEPRRADFVAWTLGELGVVDARELRRPGRVSYGDLARVHTSELLESLSEPEVLARVFGVDSWDVPVEEVLHTIRMATGGTVEATRAVLEHGGDAFNLLGGFHHAHPDRAHGLCLVNDLAVALAVVRAEGFDGQAVVIDLDAHPPDGTAACLADDDRSVILSISGSDWGDVPGVVRVVLAPGTGDGPYLAALERLLANMPRPDLALVVAGGDVLDGDHMGALAMTRAGVRARDRAVIEALTGVPTVWVPGGGYHPDAWRVLADTVTAVALGAHHEVSPDYEPLSRSFDRIYSTLDPERLGAGELKIELSDIYGALGMGAMGEPRLLGAYTAEGIEYGLHAYGLLPHYERLGYHDFRVELRDNEPFSRALLWGQAQGRERQLAEVEVGRTEVDARPVLFVNWATLRHPLGSFSGQRPRLPGQEEPGPGLARELQELLRRVARRLGLQGVALHPSWFHIAYLSRRTCRFTDPARQGRFEALMRDLGDVDLLTATHAVHDERVLLDGAPYAWEAEPMVEWLDDPDPDTDAAWRVGVDGERERARFTLPD